jgi:predicted Zn finger-like uncharacterized protein
MIIACPACATRYAVPESAIGVEGRTVRCAKCRHSWFQQAAGAEALAEAPASVSAISQPATEPAPRVAEPAVVGAEPAVAAAYQGEARFAPPPPSAEQVAPPPIPARAPKLDGFEEDRSSFEHQPPFRPRRNRAGMWTAAAALFAVIAIGAIGAAAWYGLPDWVPLARPTFAEAQPDLVLDFPPNRQDRRTLPNGTEFFGASGTIANVGSTRREVPSVLIVLRDAQEKEVYKWEVVPPKRQLAPGESITINEAVTDVPPSAKVAEIGWKPG